MSGMPITESLKKEMLSKNIWRSHCPVSTNRLSLLEVQYLDFSNNIQVGSIIVFDVLADYVVQIFHELLIIQFPIAKMNLINDYDGDDHKSMSDNNTSAFNCRYIKNTTKFSMHSYGMAIDINPVQNPILSKDESGIINILPAEGRAYVDRSILKKGMITEEVVAIFKKHHFSIWGGEWNDPKDWHHFQLSRELCEQLRDSTYEAGSLLLYSNEC